LRLRFVFNWVKLYMPKEKVCVIGLGYVGFPLAVQCSTKGYEVFGYDKDQDKLEKISRGENIVERMNTG